MVNRSPFKCMFIISVGEYICTAVSYEALRSAILILYYIHTADRLNTFTTPISLPWIQTQRTSVQGWHTGTHSTPHTWTSSHTQHCVSSPHNNRRRGGGFISLQVQRDKRFRDHYLSDKTGWRTNISVFCSFPPSVFPPRFARLTYMNVRKQTPLLFVRGDKWREKTHQSDIPPLVFFALL